MPIFRPHPAPELEGAYYLKRLASEPRFEAISGVDVDVSLDVQTVSGLGTGTRTIKATIRARDISDAPITDIAKVQLSLAPTNAAISIGAVSSLPAEGTTYVFEATLTVTLTESPAAEAITTQRLIALVESSAGRTGQGVGRFNYVTSRPSSVTTLTATSWIRGIRLTWETPDADRDGDAFLNNTTLAYYLIRKSVIEGGQAPGLTITEARSVIAAGGAPGAPENTRLYAVTGNAFVDPEQLYTHRFYYWLVSVDLFGNLSTLSNSANAVPGTLNDADITQGAIDIARVATANSVPNAMAAGTVTATKVGVLNAAFDPSKFTSNSPGAGQVSWSDLLIVINGAPFPATLPNFSGNTSSPVIIYDTSVNNVVGVASVDALEAGDMLLGFNVSGTFRPSFTGTVIRGDTIETGTILADKLDVNELSAITANLGTVTTGLIWDSPTVPKSVIRLDAGTRGITQNAQGQPTIAVSPPAGATVSVSALGVATFSTAITLASGDTFVRGTQAYQIVSGAGTLYNVTPAVAAASGTFIPYRVVNRLLDLAALDSSTDQLGAGNRRFLSVVGSGGVDRIYIAANGEAKFTGQVVAENLVVSGGAAGTPTLTVNGKALFTEDVSANTATFNLNIVNANTANVGTLRTEKASDLYALLGQYNLAASSVGVVSRNNVPGTSIAQAATTAYELATSSNSASLTTLTATGVAKAPHGGSYLLTFTPKVSLTANIVGGTAVPDPTLTIVVERRLGLDPNPWVSVATRTLRVPYLYGANTYTDYDQEGIPNTVTLGYDIGVGPGVTSGPNVGEMTVNAVITPVQGSGTVSVTSEGVVTFDTPQTLQADDWFSVGFRAYKVLSSSSSTSYTVASPASIVTNAAFTVYNYTTSLVVSGLPYDQALHPYLRVRVQGQTNHDTYWDTFTAPQDMGLTPVTYTIDGTESSISFTHLADGASVLRDASLAVVGGFLYLHPKTSTPVDGIAGEMIMRDTGSGVVPQYYDGVGWVALGGSSGSISVNGTPNINSLTFSGATVTTSGSGATITITPASTGVTSLGGASGEITLGNNLSVTGGALNLVNVLTTTNFNATVPALDGTGANGSWNINAATATALSTARNFAVTGAVTGTVSSTLSTGMSIATTLAANSVVGSTLTVGTVTSLSAAGVIMRVGGGLRVGGTIFATDFVLEGGTAGGTTGLSLNSLDDVITVAPYAPTNGQVLTWDTSVLGGRWIPKTIQAGSNIIVQDEGVQQTAAATTINFTGTNVTATAVGGVVTVNVSGSPSAHTHAIADVTGLQTALDGKSNVGHTHTIANITGLQTALDGKSNIGHTHAIADVTGLQTALDGKAANTITISAGTGLTGGGNLTANRSLALTGQALALHNLATNGIIVRTGTGTVTARTLTAAGTIITVSNGNGVSGNPTIDIVTTNITSVGTLTSLNVSGNITAGGTITASDFILTGGAPGGGTGLNLNSLDDVNTAAPYAPLNGQVLTWDTSIAPSPGQWIPKTFTTTLAVHSNSGVSPVASRQALNFISGTNATVAVTDDAVNNWINVTVSATGAVQSVFGRTGIITAAEGDYTLDQLAGVTISGTPSGRVLRHNGTAWVDTQLVAADIPTLTASKISDFNTAVRTNRLNEMSAPNAAVSFNSQNITGVATITATTFSGALSGNATTATALSTSRTFQLSGDVSGSVSNTLSAGFNISTTLASIPGLVAAAYGSASQVGVVTVDAKGRVTSASNVAIAIAAGAVSGLAASATIDTTNAANISSGTLPSGRLTGSYSGITGVGTLTALNVTGNITAGGTITATDFVLTGGGAGTGTGLTLNALDDVRTDGIYVPTNGQVLVYDTAITPSPGQWIPKTLTTTLEVQNNGSFVAARNKLNIIPGTGIVLTTTSDAERVNVTINSQLSGTVQVNQGGTGATDAATARTNLGLAIGTNVQAYDADLASIAGLAGTTGLLRKTAANTWSLDTTTYLTGNQTITLSGDASGTGTTAITVTLANSGITAGTYNNSATQVRPIVVDVKGRITGVGTAVTITPAWGSITGKPTTIAGYGITDFNTLGDARWSLLGHTHTFASLTSKPTTLAGYGITDGQPLDADLTSIAGISANSGLLRKTAANTWSLDTAAYITAAHAVNIGTTSVPLNRASTSLSLTGVSIDGSAGSVPWSAISGHRTLTRDNAGLRGDAGARSGFFETGSPTNYYAGASSWQHLIESRHSNDTNNYALQLAGSFYDQKLWMRKTNDSATTAWRQVVTNDNDSAWSISTTGSAATLTTTRTIWGQNFNGSANITGALSGATTGAFSGNVTAADFVLGSDRRLKADLVPLTGVLDKIDQLTAYRYQHLRHQRLEVGVIAQELQEVLPEAVSEMEDGMLGVTYDRLVPFLLAAVKELKARVVTLEQQTQE
jgi:hypothetical protein